MLELCVCRDIEHLRSLENTQEARVALGALLRLFRALQTSRVAIRYYGRMNVHGFSRVGRL